MRLDLDTFTEISDSLLRNKARSLLTGFGIFWGVFMLLFLLGGGDGFKQLLWQNFQGFATNMSIVVDQRTSMPYRGFKEGRRWRLDVADVERLKNMVPELDVVTPSIGIWGQTALYDVNSINCNVKGVYSEYSSIEEPRIRYGRYLNEADCLQGRKVCVIGKRIYESLFPDGGDPCGSFIKVGPVYFQVVGVDFNNGNISIQGSADESVVIPMPLAQSIYHRGTKVDLICMTGKPGVKMASLEPRITQILARAHTFSTKDKQALMFFNVEELYKLVDNLFTGLNILIFLIGLGTILAGAIGVSNIMMVTVKERTTEIGIRRAIGATPKQVLSQIIMESVSLTVVSGCSGIVFSVLVLELAGKIVSATSDTPVDFQIAFWTAILAAALLSLLGVAAGMAPALRAMNIKPVDAMRDE